MDKEVAALKRFPTRKFPYAGFSLVGDDAIIVSSTFDIHRQAKLCLTYGLSLDRSISQWDSNKCYDYLYNIGFPIRGLQFAVSSKTIQSDSKYVKDSIKIGKPLVRKVYNKDREVVYSGGVISLDCCLMGPLSTFRIITNMTDAEWKFATKVKPVIDFCNKRSIPYRLEGMNVYINNVQVLTSGHVINCLLFIAFLSTYHSYAFDFGTFINQYIDNMLHPSMGNEPSFSSYAWHSWLETEVAVYSAFSMIKTFPWLNRNSVKLALMTGVHILRRNIKNSRTTISFPRSGLRLYDNRFYTSKKDTNVNFIVMPSGSGKSTISKKYPNILVDIDECMNEETKPIHKKLIRKAIAAGDWSIYYNWYYKVVVNFINMKSRGDKLFFLVHHQDVPMNTFPNCPILVLLLPRGIVTSRVRDRDGDSKVAESNYDSVIKSINNTSFPYPVVHVSNDLQLELSLTSWALRGSLAV